MKLRGIIAATVAAIALTSCSAADGEGDGEAGSDAVTCDELADEAVRISEDKDVALLKVRAPEVSLDKQESGWDEPKGTEEVTVLRCNGQGVWSDGSKTGIRLSLKVDADDDSFVMYEATR